MRFGSLTVHKTDSANHEQNKMQKKHASNCNERIYFKADDVDGFLYQSEILI